MPVDSDATKAALDAVVVRVNAAARGVAGTAALLIQGRAQRRLHVGYGVVSGTMRRSVHVEGPTEIIRGVYAARVGPSVIYARRFELGFFGTDSLGRVYMERGTQPPDRLGSIKRPFLVPAVNESRSAIQRIAVRACARAIHGGAS